MKTSTWICAIIVSIVALFLFPYRPMAFAALMAIAFFSPAEVNKK